MTNELGNWPTVGKSVMLLGTDVDDLRKPVVSHCLATYTGRILMARKTVNRKALRQEHEAAEAAGIPAKKKVAKRKTAKRKKKSKDPADVRLKAFWGVFNQAMKQVAIFEYHEKNKADKKAEALNQSGKSPHFVRKVKKEIEEEIE